MERRIERVAKPKAKALKKPATPVKKKAAGKQATVSKKTSAPTKAALKKPVAKPAKAKAATTKPAKATSKIKASNQRTPTKAAPKTLAAKPVKVTAPVVVKAPAPVARPAKAAVKAPAPVAKPAKAAAPAVVKTLAPAVAKSVPAAPPLKAPPPPAVVVAPTPPKKPKPESPKKVGKATPKSPPNAVRKVVNLDEIKLPPGYRPAPHEEYMSPEQLAYFKRKLQNWRQELILESQETLEHLRTETRDVGDDAERASRESDNILELRTRDRYRKLLTKIGQALKRIEDGSYGFCEETGEDIGLARLEARPIATLTVDAQERRELFQRQFRDDH